MKRGSALIMALLVIAVLSVMVLSFSTEARLQSGINLYMRERALVDRLTESGQAIAEMLLLTYIDVSSSLEEDEIQDIFKDEDRWIREKIAIKSGRSTTIGPIVVDAENPGAGTVTLNIRMSNNEVEGINVNELVEGKDSNFQLRWELIFRSHGLPEDFEIDLEDVGRVTLSSHLIACWCDWVDKDDTVKSIGGLGCGAEKEWYGEYYEDEDVDEEYRKFPRNGPINDINELSFIRGFRDYPAILTGGKILGDQGLKKDEKENPTVRGIMEMFGTVGSGKVNVNDCTEDQLMSVPGIYKDDYDDDFQDTRDCVQAIREGLNTKPEHREVDSEEGPWPYEDFDDLRQRVADLDAEVGSEASEYLIFTPSKASLFDIEIIGESLGMKHTVKAKGYLKDGKVRYIEWREE